MKYLIIPLLFFSELAYSQCCKFDVELNLSVQKTSTLEELETCLSLDYCDARYYHLGRIIHAIRDPDRELVDQNFEKIINLIGDGPAYSEIDFRIINLYALYLATIGEENQALVYYHFINNHAEKDSPLRLFSSLNIHGLNNNPNGVLELINASNQSPNSKITNTDRLILIINAGSYLPLNMRNELLTKNKNAHKLASKEDVVFLYLLNLYHSFAIYQLSESEDIWAKMEESTFNPYSSHFSHLWNINQVTRLKHKAEYDKALALSKKYLETLVGNFSNNDELLDKKDLFKKVFPETLSSYAHSNLFQTRLGKGLPPVIDAFRIYEAVYNHRITKRTKHLSTITSESDIRGTNNPHDILVVGTYLYQNAQDIQYLNRAYYAINGISSGGITYWSNARALMRENKSFRQDLLEEQRLVNDVRKINKDDTLREIFDRQSALKKHRKSIEDKYQELHSTITKSYEVDLEELQAEMRQDTAACLDFFLDAKMLYRLYVSSDTIDILPLSDRARVKSLALTEQLAKMTASGKSAKAMEAASRELYDHLFEGIKDDLPPKLHIIANGKLLDVPFSVLRKDTVGEAPSYLGVEHAISRQFSLSTMRLLEETELNASYAQPLAMAPSFANEFLQASELRQAGFQLPPLVYNTEELKDLQSRRGGKYLYDDDATIESYRDKVSDYNIIHLATHAISSEVDGLRSRVYLLDKGGEPIGLYADDIGEQTLNSELVVLSACETGGGGVHYVEGRVGLTKAYLAAGARSVVSSNWAVDDHATAEQMKTFYDGIEAGQPPHVALQGARRAYVEAHPDAAPYKWAAFEAYGGMGPVRWNKEAGRSNFWWLALPVLGVGAIAVLNKRRRASRAA